jgi:aminomethyltransferase
VKFDKGDFIGKEALLKCDREKPFLYGLKIIEPGIARQGNQVFSLIGELIGEVTSGTKTPSLKEPIALARINLPPTILNLSSNVLVDVRGKKIKAEVIKLPFYNVIR